MIHNKLGSKLWNYCDRCETKIASSKFTEFNGYKFSREKNPIDYFQHRGNVITGRYATNNQYVMYEYYK